MSERESLIDAVRQRESYRWGPWPWDEGEASPPRIEITVEERDALLEAAQALKNLCESDPSHGKLQNPEWEHGKAHIAAEDALRKLGL